MRFYLPILLTVVGTSLYHVAQKSIPVATRPAVSLVAIYLTALAFTLGFAVVSPGRGSFTQEVRSLNWAPYTVGLAILAVELGFLLAYRQGWRLSVASAVANVMTALALLVVGVLFFGEAFTLRLAVGIGCCVIGLLLVGTA